MANQTLGIVSPVPMGEYSATTTYQKLNLVTYNGGFYMCRQQCVGITPSVSENWQNYWMLALTLPLSNEYGTSQNTGYTQAYLNTQLANLLSNEYGTSQNTGYTQAYLNTQLANLLIANNICTTTPTTTPTASSSKPAVVVENYVDGYTWYRLWSDGFLEQGLRVYYRGYGNQSITYTFLKEFADNNYSLVVGDGISSSKSMGYNLKTSKGFGAYFYWSASDISTTQVWAYAAGFVKKES